MVPARLIDVSTPERPDGIVVVLHGGAARTGATDVSPTQLSVLRMVPVAQRIARAGRRRLAVARLLNTHRGWDGRNTPVADARWAIHTLAERYGERPVALVGHSLGGRAALLAGDADPVRCVVALNPWVYPTDDVDLRGRRVVVVHGTDDRIAPMSRSRAVADRLGRRTDVTFTEVEGGRHAMLRHGARFERAATDAVTTTLLT